MRLKMPFGFIINKPGTYHGGKVLKLCLLLLLGVSMKAHAQLKWAPLTLKEISGDGTIKFVKASSQNPWKGILIRDVSKRSQAVKVKVLRCNKSACMGKILDAKIRLDLSKSYEVSYIGQLLPHRVPVEAATTKKHHLYGGYGSPVGPAIKLGIGRKIWPLLSAGFAYSKVNSSATSVKLDGHLATLYTRFECLPFTEHLRLLLVGELGLLKSELSFSSQKPVTTKEESTYLGSLAVEGVYSFGDWEFSIKSGFSKSGLKNKYTIPSGTVGNPYGEALGFIETGLYWNF
jgi:hypothetical protein